MVAEVLHHGGVTAVCFSCGVAKPRVFSGCGSCGVRPQREEELGDSLLLSRYLSSEQLLDRAVEDRSPGLVLKSASQSDRQNANAALRDPLLRELLGLEQEASQKASLLEEASAEHLVELMMRAAAREIPTTTNLKQSLEACLDHKDTLSPWVMNECLLVAMRAQLASTPSMLLVEVLNRVAERCHATNQVEFCDYLREHVSPEKNFDSAQRRSIWQAYQQHLVDRIVGVLERVHTDDLIDVFVKLQKTIETRRDKQALPFVKALMSVYKHHALGTLQQESAGAKRLISAVRASGHSELHSKLALIDELEVLLANWIKVAKPLAGVIADREVASIRRQLRGELEEISDYLALKCLAHDLSARTSRFALELM